MQTIEPDGLLCPQTITSKIKNINTHHKSHQTPLSRRKCNILPWKPSHHSLICLSFLCSPPVHISLFFFGVRQEFRIFRLSMATVAIWHPSSANEANQELRKAAPLSKIPYPDNSGVISLGACFQIFFNCWEILKRLMHVFVAVIKDVFTEKGLDTPVILAPRRLEEEHHKLQTNLSFININLKKTPLLMNRSSSDNH